jgi:FkbM family methyltransferase
MIEKIRSKIRQHPILHKCLLPSWIALHHLKWQVRNIITNHRPVSFQVANITLKLHCDGQIAEALYLGFESIERDFVASYVKPGMCVIDIGANIGLYTIMASALVGQSGIVHAFEPSSSTYQLLKRNIELNSCRNVTTNRLALSNSKESMVLKADPCHPSYDAHRYVERKNNVGSIFKTDEEVRCLTLDEYALNLEKIDFLKIDVEGAELMVLQGATAVLSLHNPTLMFECNRNRDVLQLLRKYDYNFYKWDVDSKTLLPLTIQEALFAHNIFAAAAHGGHIDLYGIIERSI